MSGTDIAIAVDDVSKRYKKYNEKATSLKERFTKGGKDRYEEFWAVKDVSLAIERGSFYGLVGHNGSGKSSLLRLMAGIHRPTRGKVRVNGRISALLELGAGFHPDLSGRENVYLNASILGMRRQQVDRIFDDIVDFSGIAEFIDTPVKHYSSGMFVRLGFSVAVHMDPEVLLIDEVIAVGDEEFQRQCFEHLFKLRASGTTIVIVTHALAVVKNTCSGAAWLDHGELQLAGTGSDVVDAYLAKVDRAEVARLEAEAQRTGITGGASGPSLHPIRVEQVELLDLDRGPVVVAHTGAPLVIRIHWSTTEPVDSPLFTIGINAEAGHHVGVAPMARELQVGRLDGTGYVDYVMPRLVLAPGDFDVGVDIHDKFGMVRYDHREKAVSLRVQSGGELVLGLADLQGAWEDPVGEPG